MKITILGAGAFGTAIASHLERCGHTIQIDKITDSEIIFVAVPSYVVLSALLNLKTEITNQKIVICSKGFASDKKLISQALAESFPDNNIFFLYGPTLAEELKDGKFSGMVLAGNSNKDELKANIESDTLHIELSEDIIGVQIGATLKNVVDIFIGITEGALLGENTQAYILTKGIQEIQKFGVALGAQPNTFLGLTCVGDITLNSRNRHLGVLLGQGNSIHDVVKKIDYTPEGIIALNDVILMAKNLNIEIPFMNILHAIIFKGYNIEEGIREIK